MDSVAFLLVKTTAAVTPPATTRKAHKNKMQSLLIGLVVITAGFLTGRAIHSFVNFVVEAVEKHNRENRDE